MKKYSAHFLFDYLMCNDLDNIDELENDPYFMWRVIDHTNDKRMYEFCSENVKKDFDFVKKLVLKFKDDIEFITKVSNYFIDNYSSDNNFEQLDIIELTMLLSKIIGQTKRKELLVYEINNKLFINSIENNAKTSKYFLKEYEFALYLEMFGNRKIILDYVANHILKEIYYNSGVKFEEYIHSLNVKKSNIKKMGLKNFLIEHVGLYDEDLKEYVRLNIKLLDEFAKELQIVLNHWDNYEKRMIPKKIDTFDYYLSKYIKENEDYCSLYVYALRQIILKKYGFKSKQKFCDFDIELKKETLGDQKAYKYANNLAKKIFIDCNYSDIEEIIYKDNDNNYINNSNVIEFKKTN